MHRVRVSKVRDHWFTDCDSCDIYFGYQTWNIAIYMALFHVRGGIYWNPKKGVTVS